MTRKDPFPSVFDGLPLLSSRQFGPMGLFLLRISFLLICAMPLVLSMLDAIAGVAANTLFALGLIILCLPLVFDAFNKIVNRSTHLDSLVVLLAIFFLVWSQAYVESISLIYFYHLCDLALCLLLRIARARCEQHSDRIFSQTFKSFDDLNTPVHFEDGQVIGEDCRVISGSAICSLCFLDADSGEFEAGAGDVLFAGTVVAEGSILAESLGHSNKNVIKVVKKKLRRCLNTNSQHCARLSAIAPFAQTAYVLAVLMSITFFDMPITPSLLAYSSAFFCFGFYLRWQRAYDFFLLDRVLKKGMIPENVDAVRYIHRNLDSVRFADASLCPRSSQHLSAKGIFRLSTRRPARAVFLIVERASEYSWMVSRADVALLYRTRIAFEDFLNISSAASFLVGLCSLTFIVFFSISFLVLDLSGLLAVALAILYAGVAICCSSIARFFFNND